MSYIDEHALVAADARIGERVKVWAFTQVREGAEIDDDTTIGSHTYIDAGVRIGKKCKIQTGVRIFHGVTILDGVFVGPGVVLTNDLRPRATTPDGDIKSLDDWAVTPTTVGRGASIGAGAIVVAGSHIGDYAFVGAGAVVTRPVPSHAVVVGVPAQRISWICYCGEPIDADEMENACTSCGMHVDLRG